MDIINIDTDKLASKLFDELKRLGHNISLKHVLEAINNVFGVPTHASRGSNSRLCCDPTPQNVIVEQARDMNVTKEKSDSPSLSFYIVSNYTLQSFVVLGDTMQIKDILREAGLKYNRNLKFGEEKLPGWFYKKDKTETTKKLLEKYGKVSIYKKEEFDPSLISGDSNKSAKVVEEPSKESKEKETTVTSRDETISNTGHEVQLKNKPLKEIKQIAQELNINVRGTKQDLVKRIEEAKSKVLPVKNKFDNFMLPDDKHKFVWEMDDNNKYVVVAIENDEGDYLLLEESDIKILEELDYPFDQTKYADDGGGDSEDKEEECSDSDPNFVGVGAAFGRDSDCQDSTDEDV